MSQLVIAVPPARDACGRAVLLGDDGATRMASFRVLATASRRVARRHDNPDRDRMRAFGHPPSGTYVVAGSLPPSFHQRRRPKRFGRLGALLLEPLAGEALAAKGSGRRLFVLHGGPQDAQGRLRPTRGGLRVSDADLVALFDAMERGQAEGDPLRTVEVVDLALAPSPAAVDAPGGRLTRRGRSRSTPRTLLGAAGVVVAGALALRPRPGKGARGGIGRRDFLAALALLVGGLPTGGCDSPSPCDPVACDPADPSCPPSGYQCAADDGDYGGVG